jgi:hypothetical protein
MKASVEVKASTRDLLKQKKEDLGVRSVDEVIVHLLGQREGEVDADGGERAGRKRARAAEDNEENDRVPQLFSYETLVQEEKAIKYFTGLNQSCMEWVVKAMVDAVRPFVRFRGFLVWPCLWNIESRGCHFRVTFLSYFLS